MARTGPPSEQNRILETETMDQAVMTKWEYRVEEATQLNALRETLKRAGREGWELVSVTRGTSDVGSPTKTLRARKSEPFNAFFKRPGN